MEKSTDFDDSKEVLATIEKEIQKKEGLTDIDKARAIDKARSDYTMRRLLSLNKSFESKRCEASPRLKRPKTPQNEELDSDSLIELRKKRKAEEFSNKFKNSRLSSPLYKRRIKKLEESYFKKASDSGSDQELDDRALRRAKSLQDFFLFALQRALMGGLLIVVSIILAILHWLSAPEDNKIRLIAILIAVFLLQFHNYQALTDPSKRSGGIERSSRWTKFIWRRLNRLIKANFVEFLVMNFALYCLFDSIVFDPYDISKRSTKELELDEPLSPFDLDLLKNSRLFSLAFLNFCWFTSVRSMSLLRHTNHWITTKELLWRIITKTEIFFFLFFVIFVASLNVYPVHIVEKETVVGFESWYVRYPRILQRILIDCLWPLDLLFCSLLSLYFLTSLVMIRMKLISLLILKSTTRSAFEKFLYNETHPKAPLLITQRGYSEMEWFNKDEILDVLFTKNKGFGAKLANRVFIKTPKNSYVPFKPELVHTCLLESHFKTKIKQLSKGLFKLNEYIQKIRGGKTKPKEESRDRETKEENPGYLKRILKSIFEFFGFSKISLRRYYLLRFSITTLREIEPSLNHLRLAVQRENHNRPFINQMIVKSYRKYLIQLVSCIKKIKRNYEYLEPDLRLTFQDYDPELYDALVKKSKFLGKTFFNDKISSK